MLYKCYLGLKLKPSLILNQINNRKFRTEANYMRAYPHIRAALDPCQM